MTRSFLLRIGVSVAFAGATLAACSGTATTTPSPTTAPTVEASPAASEAASPSEAASGSPEASPSEEASPGGSPEARTVQIQAGPDRFMNLPVNPTTGMILTFRNVGSEAHGMWVLMRNPDATKAQNFDNIAKLSPADLFKFVTVVGVLAADPGQVAQGQIVLDQPGDYAVVDMLPVGTATAPASPDPSAIPSGVPNFTKGLAGVFSVTAPPSPTPPPGASPAASPEMSPAPSAS
jgi:hypothetical protein